MDYSELLGMDDAKLHDLFTEEEQLLEREKKRYSEDAYERMVVEVLRDLGGQLPKGILRDWQPDVEAIISKGKALKAEKEKVLKVKKKEKISLLLTAAILLIFGVAAITYFILKDEGKFILPLDASSLHVANDRDIPSEESSCMLLVGKSTWIKVDQDNVGTIPQVGDLLISRTKEGLLKMERSPRHGHEAPTIANLEIYTKARQQCVVEIEDGTRIRMNAQSWLSYPLEKRDTRSLGLSGEAYVVTSNNTLIVSAMKGKVTATASDFVIKSAKDYTKMILNNGKLDLYSYSLKKSETLYCPNDLGVLMVGLSDQSVRQ